MLILFGGAAYTGEEHAACCRIGIGWGCDLHMQVFTYTYGIWEGEVWCSRTGALGVLRKWRFLGTLCVYPLWYMVLGPLVIEGCWSYWGACVITATHCCLQGLHSSKSCEEWDCNARHIIHKDSRLGAQRGALCFSSVSLHISLFSAMTTCIFIFW